MSIFEVVNVLSRSPFMFENTENKRWIVVHRRTETPTLGLHRAAASRLHGPVALRLHCFTVSVTSAENPAPENQLASVNWRTPQWARGQFTRTLLYQTGSKNGVIKNSDTGVNCVVPQNYDVCPLLMMHKTCSINYGHLADLQKKNTSHNWS